MLDQFASASAMIAESRRLSAEAQDVHAHVCRSNAEIKDATAEGRKMMEDAKQLGAAMDREAGHQFSRSVDLHRRA